MALYRMDGGCVGRVRNGIRDMAQNQNFSSEDAVQTGYEELDREMKKADAIVKVSDKIIQTGELALRTIKHRDEYGYNSKTNQMPDILQLEAK